MPKEVPISINPTIAGPNITVNIPGIGGQGGGGQGGGGGQNNKITIEIKNENNGQQQNNNNNGIPAELLTAADRLNSSITVLADMLGKSDKADSLLSPYRSAEAAMRIGQYWPYDKNARAAKRQGDIEALIKSIQDPQAFTELMTDRWRALMGYGEERGINVGRQHGKQVGYVWDDWYSANVSGGDGLARALAAQRLLAAQGFAEKEVRNLIRPAQSPEKKAAEDSAQRAADKAAQETVEAAKAQAKATEEQTKATQQQTRAITEQKDNTGKSAAPKDPETKAKSDRADKESRKANKAAKDNAEQTAELTKEVSKSNKATERARKGGGTPSNNGPATPPADNGGSSGSGGNGGRGGRKGSMLPDDEGNGPTGYQSNKATPIYTSWDNLLKDLAARGMHEAAEALSKDVGNRLGTGNIEGTISGIKGSFDKDGNLIGVSFDAQSSQYGKLGTAKMQYGFGQDEETGKYQVSGGIVQTSADVKRIEAERTKLARDIASTESRINTLLNKDIVKEKTTEGKNSALYDSLMSIVSGSGTLGTSGFQLNNGTNRAQLNDLNTQLDSFDGNLKSLNDRMRQDFSNRGIDDISNKAEKYQADAKTYLQQFGKMGIELKDINAVTKTGTAVGSLWDQFQKASEAFTQAQGDATKRVEAFNKMSDASKQLAAAYKVESAAQRLSKPAAQALQGAEKALALPNAEAATKQYEALGQALDKLKEADTPAKTKNATDQVQAATKELQAAVKQIDTLDKKMAGADKWMQGQREKLSDAGMKIGDVASLKQASRIISNYKQAQTLDARQKWAGQWDDAKQDEAARDTRQAIKKQQTATRMAKQDVAIEEQMTRARQVLASAGLDKNSAVAEELQNALNGMELVKNWQNFEKRGQTLGNLKDKIKAAEKSVDEIAKFDARAGLYKLQKDAQDKQFAGLASRNGGQQNWTAEQQNKYAQLAAQQEKLSTAFNAKDTEGLRIALQESALLFKQLNASLKESEQAAVKDVEDQMKAIGQERWKAGREQELASHAMAYEKLGQTYGSQALSPYQQELNQKIQTAMTSMMQGIDSVNKTATSDADKALSDGIRDLTASLKETTKLNADIKKAQEADLYGRLGQGTKEELTNAQAMLDGARSADEYAEAIERVHKAVNTANKEMDGMADDNYWDEQSKKVDIYAAKLDRMRTKNGGYDNWNQAQKDAFDGAQAQLGAMRQAVTDRSVTDLSHAQRMGNGSLSELNQRLMGTGKMIGGMGTGIDALTQKMINMASPMMVWRKMSQMIRKAGENVKAIDTQMADLKKVTDNTTGEYQQFLRTTGETAIAIGAPISDLIQTTSTFAHMGYDLATSQQLGTVATKFGNTGNFANVNDAAETIIAVVNGFDGLDITDAGAVGDKLSAVAAKYAVTADDIATGLRNSASALNVAGNNVDQSTAMITAIAETTRDAGAAGSALKVLSMRIRGAKSE